MAKPAAKPAKPAPPRKAEVSRVCGCCGAEAKAAFVAPPADTSPDLDMRPGEPARGTLRRWVNTCAFCEAVAPDLSLLTHAAKVAMSAPGYFALKAPRAVLPFLRWSMLCKPEERAEALLWAAWAAEDAGETDLARSLRAQAAGCWPTPMPLSAALRLVDVLRRAGDLAGARAQAAVLDDVALDEGQKAVLAYQRQLIAAGDTGRHLLSSALPQPARRPHVAQTGASAKKGGGFWSWLKRG